MCQLLLVVIQYLIFAKVELFLFTIWIDKWYLELSRNSWRDRFNEVLSFFLCYPKYKNHPTLPLYEFK